jgi:hypothetical protein
MGIKDKIKEWAPKLKRFIFRVMLYIIVLLWTVIRINNIEKSSGEFKDKLTRNFAYFKMNNKSVTDFIEDPSLFLLIVLLLEAVFGFMGVFGSFWGNFFSAWLFLFSNVIYFNPLLPENTISLYQTRTELFYNIGIFLSLLLVAYYPYPKNVSVHSLDDDNEEETEPETKETKQESKPASKKKVNETKQTTPKTKKRN